MSALIGVLLVMKAWRIVTRRREERWKAHIEPILEEYLRSPSSRPEEFERTAAEAPRVLQYMLVYRSFGTSGPLHEKIARTYEHLGCVDRDLRRLRSWLWWVRAEAARCLGQMRSAKAQDALLKTLKDPVLEVRLLAAWALGRIGDPQTIAPTLESLASASRLAGLRLSSTVFELGERAVEPLLRVARHEDPAVRLLVVHLLGELKREQALPVLLEACRSEKSKGVRIAAYKALGTLGLRQSGPQLREGLADEAWEVRAQAAKALGRIREESAIERLCEAMKDRQWWVRRNCGEALSLMGASGLAALKDVHLSSSDRYARDMAAQWLDELGHL